MNEFNIDIEHLSTDQRSKINTLLDNYEGIFAKDKCDVGTVINNEAFIDLQVEKYCYKRPYRCSLEDKTEIENQVTQLLKHNILKNPIVHSQHQSHWLIKKMKEKDRNFVLILET